MTQAVAPLLRKGGEGDAIVGNVTSQLGSIANTEGGAWHSYKAALTMCPRCRPGPWRATT